MNNNAAMVNDVMGKTDDYGDYGDEEGAAFTREQEAAYDFMWASKVYAIFQST